MDNYGFYVNSSWIDTSDSFSTLINPANGKPFAKVAQATQNDVDNAVTASQEALTNSSWKYMDPSQRGRILKKIADKTYEISNELARIESLNQGKTIKDALSDIRFAAWTLEYYAGWADKLEGKTIPVPGNRLDYTLRQPLGVTVHIIPWNFPFQLGIRSIAPAIASGCTVIAKPASLTPLSLLTWYKHIQDLGLPENVLQIICGSGSVIGDCLIKHQNIDGIALTGSVETGKVVMRAASETLTPVSLELGGKGANIVFEDSNPKLAAKGLLYGIFWNAGEMCWAGSRAIIHDEIKDEVLNNLVNELNRWKIGPGNEEGIKMGPLVSEEHRKTVMDLTNKGLDEGAKLYHGGEISSDDLKDGFFMNPTILTEVSPSNIVAKEEIFGPVLSVLTFSDDDEALKIANQSKFGLLNGLWTNHLQRAHKFARELESGMVTINEFPVTFPQTPFIGWKNSGIGAEQGQISTDFYTKTKNVNINLS